MKLPARSPAIRTATLLRRAQRRRVLKAGWRAMAGLAAAGWHSVPAASPSLGREVPASRPTAGEPPWRPDHTVIVVLENLSAYDATTGQRKGGKAPVYAPTSDWRFLNELAEGGARCTQSTFTQTPYGSGLPTRPSQPNYLYLFSGHHQGVLPSWFEDERSPYTGTALRDRQGRLLNEATQTRVGVGNNQIPDAWLPFASPNLGAAILQSGGTFASFSESLPYPSWNCGTDSSVVPCHAGFAFTDDYRRKHNPAVNWMDLLAPTSRRGREGDLGRHGLPVSANLAFDPSFDPVLKQGFRGFARDAQGKPLGFETLPTVSIVVPNDQHNAHSNAAKVADDWLRRHIGPYAEWARTHNSLLIITFDEDGSTDGSQGDAYMAGQHRIPTLFYGAGVKRGVCEQRMDHLNVLATALWLHGALARFRADFRRYHAVVEGSGSEVDKAWRNLQPITAPFDGAAAPAGHALPKMPA